MLSSQIILSWKCFSSGLEEDSYLKLRSGLLREFKSMSALFQRCQPALEVGIRRASADEQESSNWHDLIILNA
ncbi:hypothetical protein BB562_14505 [Lactiplantibacillus pentosus]|nr:hypothetical protein BB562_14505 [Lactiplantibacillus pentosus]GIP68718.1 hypothetical protein AWA1501_08810 [Lactiplantibacillus pentosus]